MAKPAFALPLCLLWLTSPGLAQENTVLAEVEAHCLQPGKDKAHFMARPEGWTLLPIAEQPAAITQGSAPIAVWYAIRDHARFEDAGEYTSLVTVAAEKEANDLREDLENGKLTFMTHPSGARLLINPDSDSWKHMECTLWHPDPADPLHNAILARWHLPDLNALHTPFGTQSDTLKAVRLNDQPAEISAQITQPTPLLAPMPVMLTLSVLPL